jgi:DNA-directed RNA polymerase specialized sigma24 family protein
MLTPEQQELLTLRYVDECEEWQAEVMLLYKCTAAAASKRVSRALDALERHLAGKPLRDGPLDRRLVMSNAAAQSSLRARYDG